MKKLMTETLEIPSGITCELNSDVLTVKKGGLELMRNLATPGLTFRSANNSITLEALKGNKIEWKRIMSIKAHIKNMFSGLDKKYIYKLQACNVHFPMTLKVDKDKLLINNFLGEKRVRTAKILPNVKVDVSGVNITVTSSDKEAAGQTVANFEKSTKIKNRDRRVFQDGIYLVEKLQEQ